MMVMTMTMTVGVQHGKRGSAWNPHGRVDRSRSESNADECGIQSSAIDVRQSHPTSRRHWRVQRSVCTQPRVARGRHSHLFYELIIYYQIVHGICQNTTEHERLNG